MLLKQITIEVHCDNNEPEEPLLAELCEQVSRRLGQHMEIYQDLQYLLIGHFMLQKKTDPDIKLDWSLVLGLHQRVRVLVR